MNRCVRTVIAAVSAAVVLSAAPAAQAYDTGPHQEITADALTAEGFSGDSVGVVQINNWFTDLYHHMSAKHVPYSGHSGILEQLLLQVIKKESWPNALVAAATRSHFDDWPEVEADATMEFLTDTAGVTAEWDRLRRAVYTLVQEARDEDNPAKLLAVLGMSMHPVQDFYTHTNWIEPRSGHGVSGSDGPGWDERGFGSHPTWFDLPASEREKVRIYGDSTHGNRLHGYWNDDGNTALNVAMNKDWPGRPYYRKSLITAYFASRQWIQAVRMWVGDEAFWRKAQRYQANDEALRGDLKGRHEIMLYIGHWQGQGEPIGASAPGPGGSLLNAREAVKAYFTEVGKTEYRKRFEKLIMRMAERQPTGQLGPVPSSQDMQRNTRLVVLQITNLRGEGLGDPGPDDADMYANVKIDGQWMSSAVVHGHDKFSFPDPHEPFTWIKSVPAVPDEPEPVESIEVEVRTADKLWAGTDDPIFLRLSNNLRFNLDRRLSNDFERGDRHTYSIPIDDAVRDGLRVGDINRVSLEKGPDRLAGGWKLGGVKLRVNGEVAYDNQRIDRWLENDNRTWTAPDFRRRNPRGAEIPVWLQLREDDLYYGGDDNGDIHPDDNRDTVAVGYVPGRSLTQTTKGGHRLGGRIGKGGDRAQITYKLETITPEPMPALGGPTPPPTAGAKPDLVITEFFFGGVTVKNQGQAPSGPFRVRSRDITAAFPSLAPGASHAARLTGIPCEGIHFALVDDLQQVDESSESNNEAQSEPVIC